MKAIVLVLLAAISLQAFDKLDLNGMSAPKLVVKPEPRYSEEAREARIQGAVRAKVFIDTDGLVSQVEIVQPLGFGLDLAAMESLAQWRFEPARRIKDGTPVGVWVNVEILPAAVAGAGQSCVCVSGGEPGGRVFQRR